MGDVRLGEILVADGVVSQDAVDRALAEQAQSGARLGTRLMELGLADEDAIARGLAKLHGVPSVRRKHFERVDDAIARLVPKNLARRFGVVPIGVTNGPAQELVLAMRNPGDLDAMQEISFISGARVKPAAAPEGLIAEFLDSLYGPAPEVRLPTPRAVAPSPFEPKRTEEGELELATAVSRGEPRDGPPPMIAPPVLAPAVPINGLPPARSLDDEDGRPIASILVKVGAALVAVLIAGWLFKGTRCGGHQALEVDVGGQPYFAEHVDLDVTLPIGWKYVPSENYQRNNSGVAERGALFYRGGTHREPHEAVALFSADTQGRLPSPIPDELFRQMLRGVGGSTSSYGISMSVGDCQVTEARTSQTGECVGTASRDGDSWGLRLYLWIEDGGWLVGAVFIARDTDTLAATVDEILWTVELRH